MVALGVWCQFGSFERVLIVMFALTPFTGVGAIELPALGGASITPANFFLVFYLLRAVSMRDGTAMLVAELGPRSPLFPFLLLVIWIAGSAYLLPRLFAGSTFVFSLERTVATNVGMTPLRPTSGNLSQAVYAVGGFAITCVTAVLARRGNGSTAALQAILVVTAINIAFALLDLATSATRTTFLLDFLHTANYAFLNEDEVAGLKRLTGSFIEASAFAFFSISLLGVNLSLYLMNVRPLITGPFTWLLTLFIVLSTSSAGYAGLAALYAAFFIYALVSRRRRHLQVAVAVAGFGILMVTTVIFFIPSLEKIVWNVVTATLIDKGDSASAYERGTWNSQALQVFHDTSWLGAGIGSTRGSNYALVLLSNLGIIGFFLFVFLLWRLVCGKLSHSSGSLDQQITWAARNGILASIVPTLLIGTVYDLGTMFYLLLGLAAVGANPQSTIAPAKFARSGDPSNLLGGAEAEPTADQVGEGFEARPKG